MKGKGLPLLIVLILLLAGGAMALQRGTNFMPAAASTSRQGRAPGPAAMVHPAGMMAQDPATPTAQAKPTEAVQEAQAPQTLDLLPTIQLLKARVHTHLYQPGWVYIHEEISAFNDSPYMIKLPDGTVIPNHYIREGWLHLTSDLLIDENVILEKGMDGQPIRSMVAIGSASPGDFDFGTLDRYLALSGDGTMTVSLTELDGRQVVRFSGIDKFDPPVEDIDFKQPVAQLIGDTYFDYATGEFVLDESRYVFPDGSVRLAGRHMVEIRTGQTPPAEITAMIEAKKKGEGKGP
jgi:hypothetical protein